MSTTRIFYLHLNKPLCLLKSTTERKTVAVLCTHIGCLICRKRTYTDVPGTIQKFLNTCYIYVTDVIT